MLLIPGPPDFVVAQNSTMQDTKKPDPSAKENEMKVLEAGADAVPASEDVTTTKKHYRLITVGKKQLPDPEGSNSGGTGKKELFWATVTAVGDDLDEISKGFKAKSYETKTRGLLQTFIMP